MRIRFLVGLLLPYCLWAAQVTEDQLKTMLPDSKVAKDLQFDPAQDVLQLNFNFKEEVNPRDGTGSGIRRTYTAADGSIKFVLSVALFDSKETAQRELNLLRSSLKAELLSESEKARSQKIDELWILQRADSSSHTVLLSRKGNLVARIHGIHFEPLAKKRKWNQKELEQMLFTILQKAPSP